MTARELIELARSFTDERGNLIDGGTPPTAEQIEAMAELAHRLDQEPIPARHIKSPIFVAAILCGAARRADQQLARQIEWDAKKEAWRKQAEAWEVERQAKHAARAAQAKADFAQGLADGERHALERREALDSRSAVRRAIRANHFRPERSDATKIEKEIAEAADLARKDRWKK